MTKRPIKKPPGVGHNSLPDHGDIRTAAAMEMIYEDKEKALREEKKRARSRLVEGKGLLADDMKFLKGLRDKSATEVIDVFKRQWHTVGAFYPEAHDQMDLFTKKSDAPTRAAYFTMGLLVGLQGKDLVIPPMVVGDDMQQMIAGHGEGRERHASALAGILGEALQNAADGKVTDGKTGEAIEPASAVGDKAAEDFAVDTGSDPLVVNGERYPNMRQANAARKRAGLQPDDAPAAGAGEGDSAPAPAPSEADTATGNFWDAWAHDSNLWSDEQKDTFCKWFDGLAPDSVTNIEHPGAVAEYKRLRDAVNEKEFEAASPKPKRVLPRPVWDDWGDDWTSWTGPQDMEFRRWFESLALDHVPAITHEGAVGFFNALREEQKNRAEAGADEPTPPDEATVAAGAKALQESGFVPAKAGRKPRNLAK